MAKKAKRRTKRINEKLDSTSKLKSIELKCKCGRWVFGNNAEAKEVKCWQCTTILVKPDNKVRRKVSDGYPTGWDKLERFIHADGKVYEFGEEIPELKGKYNPTPIKTPKQRVKSASSKPRKRTKKKSTDIDLEMAAKIIKADKKKKELKKQNAQTNGFIS